MVGRGVTFALVVLLGLLAGAQVTWARQELLANPGFEEVDANGFPTGWSRYGGGVPESAVEVVPDAHAGARAVRLLDSGPQERDGRYAIGVTQRVPVEEGRSYVLSVWAKAIARSDAGAVRLYLSFLPGGRLITAVAPPIGGDWQRFVIAGTAPAGCTGARVYVYSEHTYTSETLIDDASFMAVDRESLGPRFALAAHASPGIEAVRPLNLRTPIIEGGQPAAVIAAPTDATGEVDAQYAALAERLVTGIAARTGVRLQVTTDARALVGADRTVIALGNLNGNFVIERLYFNKYLEIDALKPGPGRWVLQTVHEPCNWPAGVNVLVVGASDLDGLSAGVDALLERVPQGDEWVLDGPILEVAGAEAMDEEQAAALFESPVSQDVLRDFWQAAQEYRDTGDPAWARRAKRILLGEAVARFDADPHFHITWPEETTSNMIGAMWDVLEEAPVWTDGERLAATNVILNALYVLPARTSGYPTLENTEGIIWNHTTYPLMGIYWLARYFQRFYGDVDGQIALMLRKCAACFDGQVKSWKPQEDAAGYHYIVLSHTIEYTLAENDYMFFENGNVARLAEYEVAICDNTGDLANFGDSVYGRVPYTRNQHWPVWYSRDGRFLWWLNQITDGGWQNPYDRSLQPVQWDGLVGANVFELHPEVYRYTTEQSDYGGPPTAPNIPLERCFDKIAFRESLDPGAEYFLLDGYARGKHLHYDGNCIIKFFADGQDWLVDGDYLVRNTTDHNGVSVIRNGRVAELIPSCASLESIVDLPAMALCETAVYDFNGVDWLRDIIWLKGEFVLVMDRMRAREAENYTFVGNWKMLAEGEQSLEDGRTMQTVRPGADGGPDGRFRIIADGLARSTLTGRINHVGLPIAYMRQRLGGSLQTGEQHSFHTLFFNDSAAERKTYDLRRISDEAVLITRDGEPWMVVAVGEEARSAGQTDARIVAFTRTEAWPEGSVQPAAVCDAFVARAAEAGGGAAAAVPEAPAIVPERSIRVPAAGDGPTETLEPIDLDGDGAEELVVLRGRAAHAFTAQGELRWSYEAAGTTRCVAAGDIDGDGALEVLVGSDDEHIHVLDAATGGVERTHHCDLPLRVGMSAVREPRVGTLAVADLDGDGAPDIVAGLMNANLARYDSNFGVVWSNQGVPHGTLELALHDLDGDGRPEILAANRYGGVQMLDAQGRSVGSVYSELGDVQMAVGDLDADGVHDVANGSSTGAFTCTVWSGAQRFEFPNYGFAFTEVLMGDLLAERAGDELLAASETGYVYVLGAEGEVLGQRDFGDAVNDITLLPREGTTPLLGVACDDGRVYLVDAAMNVVGAVDAAGRPLLVQTLDARLVAATADTVHLIAP